MAPADPGQGPCRGAYDPTGCWLLLRRPKGPSHEREGNPALLPEDCLCPAGPVTVHEGHSRRLEAGTRTKLPGVGLGGKDGRRGLEKAPGAERGELAGPGRTAESTGRSLQVSLDPEELQGGQREGADPQGGEGSISGPRLSSWPACGVTQRGAHSPHRVACLGHTQHTVGTSQHPCGVQRGRGAGRRRSSSALWRASA